MRTGKTTCPWRFVATRMTTSANIVLTTPATGGGWSRASARQTIYLSRLWDHLPDYIMVTPVGEQVQENQNVKFGIYAYRGAQNNLDRICLVSAVVGTYKVSALAPQANFIGNDHVTAAKYPLSTFYPDTLIITKNYGHTITKLDAATDNGKAVLVFDPMGAERITFGLVSTIAGSGKLSFELAGYDL